MAWKTIAQNILSGCLGGVLVMSAAQAQKSNVSPPDEVRAKRFCIVDDQGKVCGSLGFVNGDPQIDLGSDGSSVHIWASKIDASVSIKQSRKDKRNYVALTVDQEASTMCSRHGQYVSTLEATPKLAGLDLGQIEMTNGDRSSWTGGPVSNTCRYLRADVAADGSTICAYGDKSSVDIGDSNGHQKRSLDW